MTLEEQIKFVQILAEVFTREAARAAEIDENWVAKIDALREVKKSLLYLQDIQTIIENHVK